MIAMPPALKFLLLTFAGWVNRRQQKVIDYLLEARPARAARWTPSALHQRSASSYIQTNPRDRELMAALEAACELINQRQLNKGSRTLRFVVEWPPGQKVKTR